MTINIFVLKGYLNGKIVVVRFLFCRVYMSCAPHGYKKIYYKSMQAIDPQVHDEFATPKGLIGRIYVA